MKRVCAIALGVASLTFAPVGAAFAASSPPADCMGQSNSQTSSTLKGDVAGLTAGQVQELRGLGYTMGDAASAVATWPTDTCLPPQ